MKASNWKYHSCHRSYDISSSSRIDALPEETAARIVTALALPAIAALAATSQDLGSWVSEAATAWDQLVLKRWGPLHLGKEAESSRSALRWLETEALVVLQQEGAAALLQLLQSQGFSEERDFEGSCGILQSLLRTCRQGRCRRNIALYVCSFAFQELRLACSVKQTATDAVIYFFRAFNFRACRSVLDALRLLLLWFPFLPMDAGAGAEHIVGSFAKVYVEQQPEVSEYTSIAEAEHAVFTLLYAIIMLNTDLHHPAVRVKIKADEFVESVKRAQLDPLTGLSQDHHLRDIYLSILQDPLRSGSVSLLTVGGRHLTEEEAWGNPNDVEPVRPCGRFHAFSALQGAYSALQARAVSIFKRAHLNSCSKSWNFATTMILTIVACMTVERAWHCAQNWHRQVQP
eukprot:TRINITY_DN81747_c0_g1_i1.p1 TRINITY_DN81747_c0_g1~~TRINITY_DN81747_c0_g1_i1.p1  ORF type:complete len:402 (-),score=59.25 TRINITY_DN81747_c0_g1_i1:10-1215(-)